MQSNIFTEGQSKTSVFGLDLGTTNSVVTAKISEGLPKVLKSKSGDTTPSCLLFNEDGTYQIGTPAYKERHRPNAVYSFKKYMGTDRKLYNGFTPRDIASKFVKALLEEVKEVNPEFKNYYGIHVSVPAYFDINQIEDTKLAIEAAGYKVVGVTEEPTAAAIVYQQTKHITRDFLIFDLGGGTFDGVLVRNTPGIPKSSREFYAGLGVELEESESVLEIMDISGDNQLGGDDIDKIAADLYIKKHKLKLNPVDYQKLILTAESVKKLGVPITPECCEELFLYDFIEEATHEVLSRCMTIIDEMLNRSKTFNPHCVLCGGSTKSTIIRDELAKRFSLSTDIDPDLAVGIGNSIKYHLGLDSSKLSIIQRLAKGVGVLSGGKVKYLAEKGTIIPLRSRFVARNAEPFGDFVNIDLYQGERFTSEPTHISTLQLRDIKGHDKNGYVDILIDLMITSEGTITVEVASGDAKVRSDLILNTSEDLSSVEKEDIHPDAKFYQKFKKSAEHYKDAILYDMLEDYRATGEREVAKNIMERMSYLADKK